jgi:diguanylate cyclase (GGDEF)-like protein
VSTSDQEILDRLAAAVAAVAQVRAVVASVFDGGRQVFAGAHGLVEPWRSVRWTDEVSPLCRTVAETGRPTLIQDARRRKLDGAPGRWAGVDLTGYAGVPLRSRTAATLGTLAAISSVPRAWLARDLIVLRSFGDAFAAVLDRGPSRRDHDALEQAALHDDLTGLLNRRGFHLVASAQLAVAHRQHAAGLLIYFDLDGLKVTNDRDGHAAGDDALRRAADVLRVGFRATDCMARIGGDEFVVLAIDAPERDVGSIMARLDAELERVNRRSVRTVAWSVGVVAIDPERPEALGVMLAEADGRMYAAKRGSHVAAAAAPFA